MVGREKEEEGKREKRDQEGATKKVAIAKKGREKGKKKKVTDGNFVILSCLVEVPVI